MESSATMAVKLAAIVLFSPIFIFPSMIVALLGGGYGKLFMKAQLSVKREMSVARGPVLGHFGAAIAGLGASGSSVYSTMHSLCVAS